jgi:MoxR-like ATPase
MESSWKDVEKVLNANVNCILYGPPGTGKTRAGASQDHYSITLTMETPAAELRGHFVPKGNEFIWHDGPALRAWRECKRLVLNEIDQASGDALTFLHALLDDPEVARITLPTGETVVPAEGFHAIATTNATDLPLVIPEALLDRFAVRVLVDEHHPKALEALKNEGLAELVRKTVGKPPKQRVSLRQVMAYNKLKQKVPNEVAAKVVFGTAADAATLASVLKVAGRKTKG